MNDSTDVQRETAAWRCAGCGSTRWVAAGRMPMDPDPGVQCVPCGRYDWNASALTLRERA